MTLMEGFMLLDTLKTKTDCEALLKRAELEMAPNDYRSFCEAVAMREQSVTP